MPQRFLRPGITNSERWNSIPFDAQSLFVRLLTIVDDFGRCDGRTAVIAATCFAVWNEMNTGDRRNLQQVERMLQQLDKSGLTERYESDGKKVLQIAQWQERVRAGVKERWPCRKLQQINGDLLPSSPLTLASTPSPIHHKLLAAIPSDLLQVENFVEEWDHFRAHRKKLSKPMTAHAEELLLAKLAQRPTSAIAGIGMAIERGWRGFEWAWFDSSDRNSQTGAVQRKQERSSREYPSNVNVQHLVRKA